MSKTIRLNTTTEIQKGFRFGLLIIGIFLITSNAIFYGIISLLVGVFALPSRGLEFNVDNKTYREFSNILGIYIGNWTNYSEMRYISVFKTKVFDDDYPQNRTYSEIIKVNLFYNQNQHITVYQNADKMECLRIAEDLKAIFNVEIFDKT